MKRWVHSGGSDSDASFAPRSRLVRISTLRTLMPRARGNWLICSRFSSTRFRMPCRDSRIEVSKPTGPAPAITTGISTLAASWDCVICLNLELRINLSEERAQRLGPFSRVGAGGKVAVVAIDLEKTRIDACRPQLCHAGGAKSCRKQPVAAREHVEQRHADAAKPVAHIEGRHRAA